MPRGFFPRKRLSPTARQALYDVIVTHLAAEIAKAVRDHCLGRMAKRGASRDTTLECLNALAVNVAVVLAGTGADPEALAFFEKALEQNLRDYERRG